MSMTFTQVALVIIGLYMIAISIYDMMRDSSRANIVIQGLMIAIGGGLTLYGFNVKVAKDVVKSVSQAVQGGPRP
jgi:hypothetical protein